MIARSMTGAQSDDPARTTQARGLLLFSSPTMSSDPSLNESLISALQSLAAKKVTNRKELAAWRLAADRLEESLTPEQQDAMPHFVWHYLADADIRLRNASYRADQERRSRRRTPTGLRPVGRALQLIGQRLVGPGRCVRPMPRATINSTW